MKLNFTKMHGTGNDFIMLNGFDYHIDSLKLLAENLCNRHFGIGGDGLIIALPPTNKQNDFRMRIFNADGSEAEMCGNGIRCFAYFLQEENMTQKNKLKIETLAGIIKPEMLLNETSECKVRVNMGRPQFHVDKIPIKLDKKNSYVQEHPLKIEQFTFKINCVSMGNPHTIIFNQDIEQISLEKWGQAISKHYLFPEETNVEFIQVINPNEINMKVWERGSGITLACGTGASASVVAGIKNNLLDNKVLVHLPGGDLTVEWSGSDVLMTGPAKLVFSGEIEISDNI